MFKRKSPYTFKNNKKQTNNIDNTMKVALAGALFVPSMVTFVDTEDDKVSADTLRYWWDVYEEYSYTASGSYYVSDGYNETVTQGYYERVTQGNYETTYTTRLVPIFETVQALSCYTLPAMGAQEYCDVVYASAIVGHETVQDPHTVWVDTSYDRWVDTSYDRWVDTSYYEHYSYTAYAWRDTNNDVSTLDSAGYTTGNVYRNKRTTVENYHPRYDVTNLGLNAREEVTFNLNANDPDGTITLYEISSNNTFVIATIDQTGNVTIKADKNTGESTVTVKVTDNYGDTVTKTFKVNVVNEKPVISNLSNVMLEKDEVKIIDLAITDKDKDELTYTLTQEGDGFLLEQPDGVNSNRIELTGVTNDTKGSINVLVTDEAGNTETRTFEVWVNDITNKKTVNTIISRTVEGTSKGDTDGEQVSSTVSGVNDFSGQRSIVTAPSFTETLNYSDMVTLEGVSYTGSGSMGNYTRTGNGINISLSGGTVTRPTTPKSGSYSPRQTKTETSTDTLTNRSTGSYSFASTKAYNSGGYKGTLNKSGGVASNHTSGQYYTYPDKTVTAQTSSYYSDGDGYSGSLSSYVYSGTYTPADTKYVTDQPSSWYNSGGYSGTLTQYVKSGSQIPSDTKFVTDQPSASYNSGGYIGTLTQYVKSGILIPGEFTFEQVVVHGGVPYDDNGYPIIPQTYYYKDARGFEGVLPLYEGGEATRVYYGRVDKPATDTRVFAYQGNVTKPASDTRVYAYQGSVTKPVSDTRVYRYQGTVSKPDSDQRKWTYSQNYSGTVEKPMTDTRKWDYEFNHPVTIKYDSNHQPLFKGLKATGTGDAFTVKPVSNSTQRYVLDIADNDNTNKDILPTYEVHGDGFEAHIETQGTGDTRQFELVIKSGADSAEGQVEITTYDKFGAPSTQMVSVNVQNTAPEVNNLTVTDLDGNNIGTSDTTGEVSRNRTYLLNIDATDVETIDVDNPQGRGMSYTVIATTKNGTQAKITPVGHRNNKQWELDIANDIGQVDIAVTATDLGNMTSTVKTYTIDVVNQKPTATINKDYNFIVLDDKETSEYNVTGVLEDLDNDNLTTTLTHGALQTKTQAGKTGDYIFTLKGAEYTEGIYNEQFNIVTNDGLDNSEVVSTIYPVIKVADAEDYMNKLRAFAKSTTEGNENGEVIETWTHEQHKAFYDAYIALQTYETKTETQDLRTYDNLDDFNEKMETAINITGIEEITSTTNPTLKNWENRRDLVKATVEVEIAETKRVTDGQGNSILDKVQHEKALDLVIIVQDTNSQQFIQEPLNDLINRVNELRRYHKANDDLTVLEIEMLNRPVDEDIVNLPNILTVTSIIKTVENTTNKRQLQDRMNKLKRDYLTYRASKGDLSLEDIANGGDDETRTENVKSQLEDMYLEYQKVFHPIGENENLQDLVNFVNALAKHLVGVNEETLQELKDNTPTYVETKLADVITYSEDLVNRRNTEINHAVESYTMLDKDYLLSYNGGTEETTYDLTLTSNYINLIEEAMKETRDYNINTEQEYNKLNKDETELEEAVQKVTEYTTKISLLGVSVDNNLSTNLQSYIENNIPFISISEDDFEYINDGKIYVTGHVTDNDFDNHKVEIQYNGLWEEITALDTDDNGVFTIEFDVTEKNIHSDNINIRVYDDKTIRYATILRKPVVRITQGVTVQENNVDIMKNYAQRLQLDLVTDFGLIEDEKVQRLLDLAENVIEIDIENISDRNLGIIESSASEITGGKKEVYDYTQELIHQIRLEWIFNNHTETIVSDYEKAKILEVDDNTISTARQLIEEYKQGVEEIDGLVSKIPQPIDYTEMFALLPIIETTDEAITAVGEKETLQEVLDAITTAKQELANLRTEADKAVEDISYNQVKDWLIVLTEFDIRMTEVDKFEKALAEVLKAENPETGYTQELKDTAQALVDLMAEGVLKVSLNERLDEVQAVINVRNNLDTFEQKLKQSTVEAPTIVTQADKDAIVADFETITRAEEIKAVLEAEYTLMLVLDEAINLTELAEQKAKDVVGKTGSDDTVEAQTAVETATSKVTAVDDKYETEKENLTNRLGVSQTEIDTKDNQNETNEKLEEIEDYIDTLTGVTPKDEDDETDYNIDDAQDKIDAIQEIIDSLPTDGEGIKDELQDRLDDVQQQLDEYRAEKAVEEAERTLETEDYDNANELVDNLQDETENPHATPEFKESLEERLSKIEDIIEATKAVEVAENLISDDTETVQTSKDTAQVLVDQLTPEEVYNVLAPEQQNRVDELVDRLNELQAKIDATEAVLKAEETILEKDTVNHQEDKDNALLKVLEVEEGEYKESLITRLNEVQDKINTLDALIVLENTEVTKDNHIEIQNEINKVQNLINEVDAGTFKDEMQDRLDAIQVVTNEKSAEDAVDKLEENTNSGDKDSDELEEELKEAEEKIDKVSDEDKKEEMQDRIEIIKDVIEAIKLVEKAEENLTQEDKDSAQQYVDEIQENADYNEFVDVLNKLDARLDEVQDKMDARTQVEKVEDLFTNDQYKELQEELDKAQTLTNEVEDGAYRQDLQDRIDAVQEAVNNYNNLYTDAVEAIEKAETEAKDGVTKDIVQESINEARDKVNELHIQDDKDELNGRLDALQDFVDDYNKLVENAIKAVERAEETLNQVHKNIAESYVALLDETPIKTELQDRLVIVQDKIDATKLVEKAEILRTRETVQTAQDKVITLPEGDFKQGLLDRLNAITFELDEKDRIKAEEEQKQKDKEDKEKEAEEAVDKAEESEEQEDKDKAQELVDELEDGDKKDELQDRLDDLQEKIEDNTLVEEIKDKLKDLEEDYTDEKAEDIQDLIDTVKDEEAKQEIQDELDRIVEDNKQEETDKNNKEKDKVDELIKEIEEELKKDPVDVDKVQDLIDQLPDGYDKDRLQDELDKIKEQQEQDKVDELIKEIEEELKKDPVDVDKVQDLIDQLPDGEEKDRLQDELDKIKEQQDKEKEQQDLIKEIESELKKDPVDVDKVQDLINKLPDGKDKDRLQEELDKIKEQQEVNPVEELIKEIEEELKKQPVDIDKVQDLINKLPDGEEKTRLQEELDRIIAEKAVEKAEETLDLDDYYDAVDKVDKLPESDFKESLQDRLEKLEKGEIEKRLEEATKAVEKAELTSKETDINKAQDLVDALPVGKDKTELQYRLDKIKDDAIKQEDLEEATKAVEKAEEERTQTAVDSAREPVEKLKPSMDYDDLTDRLNKVQEEIDMYAKYVALLEKENVTKPNLTELGYEITRDGQITTIDKAIDTVRGQESITGKEIKSVVDKAYKDMMDIQTIVDEIVTLALENKVSKERMALIGVTDLSNLDLALFVGLIQNHVKDNGRNSIDLEVLLAIIERVKLTAGETQDNSNISFTDTEGHWASKDIDRLVALGLIDGGGLFSPNADISRAQYAVILARTLGLEREGSNPFNDISGEWYEDYVVALYEKGMTTGVTDEEYSPDAPVTRQQSMAMLGRLIDAEGVYIEDVTDLKEIFEDADTVSEYAVEHIEKLVTIDAVEGSGKTIAPKVNLTRAQMAKIVSKTIEFVQKGGKL